MPAVIFQVDFKQNTGFITFMYKEKRKSFKKKNK